MGTALILALLSRPAVASKPPAGVAPSRLALRTAKEIREEATRSNSDPIGHPLPLAANWNSGASPARPGYTPEYQMRLIRQGHHLLPWFRWPDAGNEQDRVYFEAPITEAARLRLPISLEATQWEAYLTSESAYRNLPPEKNPNEIGRDGKVLAKVSPFGPVEPWREVGARWGQRPMLARIEQWYPNPPRVLLISNNEHPKLYWTEAESSKRYLDRFGPGRDVVFKRQVFGNAYIARYRALQASLRGALTSPAWRQRSLCIGYDAFGPYFFGRWDGWQQYWMGVPGRVDPSPLMWDGGSPSYYVNNWDGSTDYTVFSPQVQWMSAVFMQKEALRLNPRFWFEISVWDGSVPGAANDRRKFYAAQGQSFTPARYGGYAQFGMWLLRPRVLREFRGWVQLRSEYEPYFLAIVDAVDRVYRNPVLRSFWRKGKLVPNRAHPHPFSHNIPEEYQSVDRWYMLDTNLDPPRPWSYNTVLPVFSLALVMGKGVGRQWLVYAHSPLTDRKGVEISLPGYGLIRVDVPVAGAFYRVDGRHRTVACVGS